MEPQKRTHKNAEPNDRHREKVSEYESLTIQYLVTISRRRLSESEATAPVRGPLVHSVEVRNRNSESRLEALRAHYVAPLDVASAASGLLCLTLLRAIWDFWVCLACAMDQYRDEV